MSKFYSIWFFFKANYGSGTTMNGVQNVTYNSEEAESKPPRYSEILEAEESPPTYEEVENLSSPKDEEEVHKEIR